MPQSATPADECAGLATACSRAAKELKAARELITGYEQHIQAAEERIILARKEIESLKELGKMESDRAKELEHAIAAEREEIKLMLKHRDLQEKRIKSLEKSLARSRKLTLVLGAVAAVGILIGVAK